MAEVNFPGCQGSPVDHGDARVAVVGHIDLVGGIVDGEAAGGISHSHCLAGSGSSVNHSNRLAIVIGHIHCIGPQVNGSSHRPSSPIHRFLNGIGVPVNNVHSGVGRYVNFVGQLIDDS